MAVKSSGIRIVWIYKKFHTAIGFATIAGLVETLIHVNHGTLEHSDQCVVEPGANNGVKDPNKWLKILVGLRCGSQSGIESTWILIFPTTMTTPQLLLFADTGSTMKRIVRHMRHGVDVCRLLRCREQEEDSDKQSPLCLMLQQVPLPPGGDSHLQWRHKRQMRLHHGLLLIKRGLMNQTKGLLDGARSASLQQHHPVNKTDLALRP